MSIVKARARTVEVTSDDDASDPSAQVVIQEPEAEGDDAKLDKKEDKAKPQAPEKLSAPLREIRTAEDQSLRDWLTTLGEDGAYKVVLSRERPTSIRHPQTGREVATKGHLNTYEHAIDEELIQREWGGGSYHLKVLRRTADGSYKFQKGFHRTVEIAGDPDLTRLPGSQAAAPAARDGDSPSVIKQAFDVITGELAHARGAQQPKGMDPGIAMLLEQNARREEAREREAARREESHRQEMAAMRAELASSRNVKPETDPIKDKLLNSMLDGRDGHVTALNLRHEAEIRQLKESAVQDLRRIEDRHDRTTQEMRQSHELSLASVKQSYEREISALRQSHEIALGAAKASYEVQVRTLDGDIKRLERDNERLTQEVRELREKKDKPLIEQIKDMKTLKETFLDEDGGEKSGWDKFAELASSPAAAEAVGKIFGGKAQTAPVQAQAVAAPAAGPQILRSRATGAFVHKAPDGTLVPIKKKPKVVQQEDGTQLELPEISPESVAQIVGLLERAFSGGQDPVIVAQSSRPHVPQDILAWIQSHETDTTSGVDLFLSKVAKLPGTSPLSSSQRGRNWVRALGKALVSG